MTGTSTRHAAAAVALVIVTAGVLLSFQPVRSPWWTGGDADSVYLSGSLSLMGGELTKYYDHPGIPLQELLAATFQARWLVDGHGTRAEQSAAWFAHLDATRWAFRTWAILFYLGSALAIAAITGAMFRDARAAAAGGLLFLGAPQVPLYAIEFRPDVVIGPLSVAVVALLAAAAKRRSALLYLAAACLIGFTVSVKLHAIGLLAPLAVALALGRPPADWVEITWPRARTWIGEHRRTLTAAAVVWLLMVVVLNIGSAAGPRSKAVAFVAAAVVLVLGCVALIRLAPRLRLGALGSLVPAMLLAALAGFVIPNLFYARTVPTMSRWVAAALLGRGVNSDASPLTSGLGPLKPWLPYLILALLGLVRGLRAGDRTVLVWAAGAASMGLLAAARFATPHYFIPAVALAIPLIVRSVLTPGTRGTLVLVAAVVLLVAVPYRDGYRAGRAVGHKAATSARLDGWASTHLHPGQAALSTIPDGDTTYAGYIEQFATNPPRVRLRVFSATPDGLAEARAAGLRAHLIVDPGRQVDVASLGLRRVGPAPGAPRGIDVVAKR